jgi:hypothetical protein
VVDVWAAEPRRDLLRRVLGQVEQLGVGGPVAEECGQHVSLSRRSEYARNLSVVDTDGSISTTVPVPIPPASVAAPHERCAEVSVVASVLPVVPAMSARQPAESWT